MLALLLGAGFSKWAAGLPLASELFDFAIEPFGVRECQRLQRLKDHKQEWDENHPNGLSEEYIADMLSSSYAACKEAVLWYVARCLSEPYIWQEWHAGGMRRHVMMIDENRKWERSGVRQAAAFIAECGPCLSGIITLNYDLLVEYALGLRGFNYGSVGEVLHGRGPYPVSQWRNPVVVRGSLPLSKLHGSISWDSNGKYTDGRRGLSGKALIVAPLPEKHPPSELASQWTLAARILGHASRLLVFGFAFNEYDQAILQHLKGAGENLRDVAIVDISSQENSANRLWPNARIWSFQPAPKNRGLLRSWLDRV